MLNLCPIENSRRYLMNLFQVVNLLFSVPNTDAIVTSVDPAISINRWLIPISSECDLRTPLTSTEL